MKRTTLRRRSPNRPKWENTTLRKEYKDAHGFDELARYFPEYLPGLAAIDFGGPVTPVKRYEETACECHHISGGVLGTPRWDITTNLIHLSKTTHRWCELFQRDGVALCAAAKIDKGEWEWERMQEITHLHSIMGWLESGQMRFDWTMPALLKAIRDRG